jgi:hypothetical protein
MLSAEATDRSAATAGLALVARLVGIVEVRAARSLKQVPRGGRLVAQLTRRAGAERARGQAIVAPHAPIRREIGVADQRADAIRTEPEGQEASIRKPLVADIHARYFPEAYLRVMEQEGATIGVTLDKSARPGQPFKLGLPIRSGSWAWSRRRRSATRSTSSAPTA